MNDADSTPRILLAEDSRANRLVAGAILNQAGYGVDEAPDGIAAVRAAGERRYALILMDLEMPGIDGVEAARRIRKLPHPRGDVPILALTGGSVGADRDRCLAAGMDGFLSKPVDRVRLLEAVAHWVEAGDAPAWVREQRTDGAPLLLNRCTLAQLEEDVGTELLPEILATFLVETERRVRALAARARAGDIAGAADEAHALKGSAGTFGAMALRQCACELEQAGRAGDADATLKLLPTVEGLTGQTCNLLRAEYDFLAPLTPAPPIGQ